MRNRHKYPDNWEDTIRPAILKRDNYTCQHCGLKHRGLYLCNNDGTFTKIDKEEFIEAQRFGQKTKKVFLQVAHLDHNPANIEDNNLLSLCCGCHLNNDRAINNIKRISKTKN